MLDTNQYVGNVLTCGLRSESNADRHRRLSCTMRAILLVFLVCVLQSVAARTSHSLKVKLPHGGVLVGRHATSHSGRHVHAFKGVPFAEPPIGALRFKAPVPFEGWTGERLAVKDAPLCMQRDPYRRDYEIEGSEDCLYLNVYKPEEPRVSGPLPVMVWFHGGGWMCGSGMSSFYAHDYLLDHDIVLVIANYRLGPLGFLSTETLNCPGNYGLKDQLEVLRWVQQNIVAFGGDPNSVTLFGESAGGASITYHMLSEKSKGLFHKGIVQSGTYFNPWALPAYKGVAARRTRHVAELVGCNGKDDWPALLNCLRQKDAKDVTATIYDLHEWDFDPMIPFPPVLEPSHKDAFLTVCPRSQSTPHGFSLPLIIGATSEEGLIKTAPLFNLPGLLEDFKENFQQVLPIVLNYDHHAPAVQRKITKQIENFYFKQGHNYNQEQHQNLTNLISDSWFLAGIDEYLRLRLQHLNSLKSQKEVPPTYVYLFQHKGAASFSEIFRGGREVYYGVSHAEDLRYLFPIDHEYFASAVPSKEDVKIREMMVHMWVNFANSSNPTPPTSQISPTWQLTSQYPVNFVSIGGKSMEDWTHLRNEKDYFQQRVEFWQELHPYVPAEQYKRDEL